MIPNLPAELKAALAHLAEGLSRKDAAQRAGAISRTYRSGGGSDRIRTSDDALAYALARMPATYAAIAASLNALVEASPAFAPQSLLDVGAGPGTATWAAAEAFTSLGSFTLLDANAALRDLAIGLAQSNLRLAAMRYEPGDASRLIADAPEADCVVASYVINELNGPECTALTDAMWAKTRDTLLVIEPGTPAGYARIIKLRARLVARGAHVLAPCPHDRTCPLVAPDWCHFSQRLARSRAHKDLKGADVPFEDERFIYVALTRTAPTKPFSRVLAQPSINKVAVTARLCAPDGLQTAVVPRRSKTGFAAARRWDWGDAVSFDDQKA